MVKDERNFIFLVLSQPCRAEVSAMGMTRVSEQLRKVDQEERPRVPDRVREDGGRTANLRR